MSDKPQEAKRDILDEIMDRDPAYSGEPPKETAPEAPPVPEQDGKKESPPPEKKNKRSSVYLYLLVLFGAAFLMLLLAYFVQQRNSENTISDLRDSMNLSRDELMEEIEALEAEKQTLLEEKEDLQSQLDQTQSQVKSLQLQMEDLDRAYKERVSYESMLKILYDSEVKLNSGDYAGAAERFTGIKYWISFIDFYDAEIQKGNPLHPEQWMLLRPRFDELVSVLTERGVLAEDWLEEQQP